MRVDICVRLVAVCTVWMGIAAPTVRGQRPDTSGRPAQPVFSMGQPRRWQPYAVGSGVFERRTSTSGSGASVAVGVHHPIVNPVLGLFGPSLEAYASAGGAFDGIGGRILGAAPVLGLSAGADWNASASRLDFVLSYQTAIRRGGLLGHGTMVRVDWLPTRARTLGVGVQAPLLQPLAGRTRPRETGAHLPEARDASLPRVPEVPGTDSALTTLAASAERLRVYTSAYTTNDERVLALSRRTYDATIRAYLDALSRAFGAAAADARTGEMIARRARRGVLDAVILPYDSLFGQVKAHADIRGLTALADERFVAWLRDSSRVSASRQSAVAAVHARWLRMLEDVHRGVVAQWKDSRLAWLPLQLALAPDEYDEQAEVDSLMARVVGRPFTDENAISYLRSADLPLEIARSIYAARDYHVLWIHDFTGQRESGTVDNIGYSMVADAYLPALTAAVARYDATGRLPVFMILIDQFFYEPRNGRLWMTILENPLQASMKLPGNNPEREAHLRERQRELRAAVARSTRLQSDGPRSGSAAWLRKVVKVNVSVLAPSDFSFRSARIMPPVPFTPDNVMRDHRKIAFYDLNEADPYRGAMLLMGIGLGEHYASATWEDRGYRLRGPAALEVRDAVRRTLRQNGVRDEDIPAPLRAMKGAPPDSTTERRMNRGDYVGRALQVHNEIGFGRKESSVARAMLYTLAQPGSVIIVPDPLWLSESWAGMLTAAALRGSRVFIVAPALANAPSPQAPLMSLEHDVMRRVLELHRALGDDFRQAGGDLRVGLFAARAQVNDVQGRAREVREGLRRAPWIRELIPFDDKTLAVLDRASAQAAGTGEDATDLAHDERARAPQLHQKTELVARPGAIAALVRQPGWDEVLARGMRAQSRQTARFAEQLGWTTPDVETEATRSNDALLRAFETGRSEADRRRVSFYFSLGTQNHDPRGLMTDGEASVIVSGFHAAAGLVDLFYLMARTSWITTEAELNEHLPPRRGLMRRVARAIRAIL